MLVSMRTLITLLRGFVEWDTKYKVQRIDRFVQVPPDAFKPQRATQKSIRHSLARTSPSHLTTLPISPLPKIPSHRLVK